MELGAAWARDVIDRVTPQEINKNVDKREILGEQRSRHNKMSSPRWLPGL